LFSGGTTRKHAFSAGEEIAGRVERIEHGTIIVDVFGKATAIVDADEPRDIPVIAHEPETPILELAAPEAVEPPREEDAAHPPQGQDALAEPAADEVPAPIQVPTPETAELELSDASEWEFSPTEVTNISDDDLGEADTVVSAQAFDPTSAVEAQLAVTQPPGLETAAEPETAAVTETAAEPEPAAVTESAAVTVPAGAAATVPVAEPETAAVTETAAESAPEPAAVTVPVAETAAETGTDMAAATDTFTEPPPEDPADADLSLLDPLPSLEVPQVGAIFRGRIGAVAESGHIAIVNRVIDKAAVRKACARRASFTIGCMVSSTVTTVAGSTCSSVASARSARRARCR
jgi:hypothetical protein